MNRSRCGRLMRRIWAGRYLYLMFLPVFLYYVIFRYGPMLGLSIAFKDFNAYLGFDKSPWVGFKYFQQFFNSIYLWRLVRNTLLINLYDLVFNFPAAIILALLLNEVQNRRFKKTVQTITFLPYFISSVVIASMVVQFLSPSTGIVNNIIAAFGGERQYFMTQPESFRTIYTTAPPITIGVAYALVLCALFFLGQVIVKDTDRLCLRRRADIVHRLLMQYSGLSAEAGYDVHTDI